MIRSQVGPLKLFLSPGNQLTRDTSLMRSSQVLTTRPGEPPGAKHRPLREDTCGLWAQFRELGFSEDDAECFLEMSPNGGEFGAKEENL